VQLFLAQLGYCTYLLSVGCNHRTTLDNLN
jgi:hypothetical protein